MYKPPRNYKNYGNTTQHNTTQHNTTQHNTTQLNTRSFFSRVAIMATIYICVLHQFLAQGQWNVNGSQNVSVQPNIFFNEPIENRIYFGSSFANYIRYYNIFEQESEPSSNIKGLEFKLNNTIRFNISESSIDKITQLEPSATGQVSIGLAGSTNAILMMNGVIRFPDNTVINSASFITSIIGQNTRIGTLETQMLLANTNLVLTNTGLNLRITNLQNTINASLLGLNTQLLATNTGLNLRISNLETGINSTITGFNTQFSSLNSQILNFNNTISGFNTQFSNLNNTISGFSTQFSNINNTISGFNTQFSNINNTISGFNTQFSNINTQFTTLNAQFSNTWQVKPNGLAYTAGSVQIGNKLLLQGSPILMYVHSFGVQTGANSWRSISLTTTSPIHPYCPTNSNSSTKCGTSPTQVIYVLSSEAEIINTISGLVLQHTAGNGITITPQGAIRFKDGSEIGGNMNIVAEINSLKTKTINIFNKNFGGEPTRNFVGINIDDPRAQLDVNGNLRVRNLAGTGTRMLVTNEIGLVSSQPLPTSDVTMADLNAIKDRNTIVFGGTGSGESIERVNNTDIALKTNFTERLKIMNDGRVQIGSQKPTTNDYKLSVDGNMVVLGKIATQRVYCSPGATFPDYVFDANYKLMSLSETEDYINKNHHLPDFDNGDLYDKNGIDVGHLILILTKKTEELTLHLINLKKENEQMKKQIDKLK